MGTYGRLQPLSIPNPNDMFVPAIATVYIKDESNVANRLDEAEIDRRRLVCGDAYAFQGENSRVAVECDGDRWHGPERWQYDHRRQCQLERAGWKFWRISSSAFYRDKEKAMAGLWKFLDAEGIKQGG
ncbi:MAG: DUF559 domain-containing protein [Nitrospirae bacterium]|nr:DUF559 domain-containing protein [Nitrospirota bacterium]